MTQVPVAQRHILIIDDDTAVRNSLKFSLEAEGFRVLAYASPNELLNETNLPDPSCLIVNYNMPTMNGLECVARLRDRHLSIPVILATGHLSDNIRQRAVAAGVFTLEKPFFGNRLFDCVERAFEQAAKPRT